MPNPYKIKWSITALRDLQRLHSFLKPKNKQAARKAVAQIKKAVHILETEPKLGNQLKDNDTRRELYPRFGKYGYAVRYSLDEGITTVHILRVWHSREDRE